MKQYTMSAAAAMEHKHEHPERTARRNAGGFLDFDVIFQVWPNRPSMVKTIRMQEKRTPDFRDWKAVEKLRETEGY